MSGPEPPLAILAELTHRCPLRCPYCSNPLALEARADELDTETWCRVLDEAAAMGVLQVHFSGGEPTARHDLDALIAHATQAGLYSNLITSAVALSEKRVAALDAASLEHVQISFQGARPERADIVAGYDGAHQRKLTAARLVSAAGLALTLNAVMHRQNLDQLEDLIELALDLGARRLEVAHVQYYGWGLKNRTALLPTWEQVERSIETVDAARQRLQGRLVIDFVVPDYYAKRPKSCMSGWARRFLNITPRGRVLPCHAAETITDLHFPTVEEMPLAEIWYRSEAFNRFRGTDWMPEPCRSCEFKEIDWGGCRCQALALTGNAANTDPVCEKSPLNAGIRALAEAEAATAPPAFVYRSLNKA